MIRAPWGSGRLERILVYGMGLSGKAAARFLLARGVEVLAVDARPAEALGLGDLARQVTLIAGEPTQLPARNVDAVVVSPGVPLGRPLLADARRRGVPVIAEVELAFPFLEGTVIAITGSNGKSTTTALTGAILRAAGRDVEVCGNIGEPLVGRVDGPPNRVFVVELSSFQIEGIVTFVPHAAAFLNLAEDHLDRYAGLDDYAEAKRALFRGMGPDAVAVLNADEPWTLEVPGSARRRLFSRVRRVDDGCFVSAKGRVLETIPGTRTAELFYDHDVPLTGVQNLENAMAAALLARAVGVEPEAIRRGIAGFRGLPHRLEKVGEAGGVAWYDDSKGTNPAATAKSLEGFPDGSVHIILGGRNKGADLAALAPLLARKARRAYLIGEAAGDFARSLEGRVPFEAVGTLERAVAAAAAEARPGEVVVLSPACASFDQFKNFVHRGEAFQALVHSLLGGPHGEEAGL